MHQHAPTVEYPVGRLFLERRLLVGVALLWAVSLWGWWLAVPREQRSPGGWVSWAAAAVLLWVTLWRERGHPDLTTLEWRPDSARPGVWYWRTPARPRGVALTRVQWVWDAQAVVLLRLHTPDGFKHWVWVGRSSAPTEWRALRQALVAHAS